MVQGHGPFSAGGSLEACLHHLSVLENSALLLLSLRRRGVDTARIQRRIAGQGFSAVFPCRPQGLDVANLPVRQVADASTVADFAYWLAYNYSFGIGAYGTGSMSQKTASDEMIFCPMSAVPEDMDFPLYRVPLKPDETDSRDLVLHKLIYAHTHFATCMITTSPLATAEGMAVLAEAYGKEVLAGEAAGIPYTADHHPVILPIDAEAIYLNPRIGLVDASRLTDDTAGNPILNMLRWHKGCCVVAGYGVISTGDTTLEQTAHNAASAERIGRFRMAVFINEKMLNGPPLKSFEP
jgi:ribulose-5-phosphate 4-epimerase/fuculose-1-phosphate aldolase